MQALYGLVAGVASSGKLGAASYGAALGSHLAFAAFGARIAVSFGTKNGSALHPVKFLEDRYQALIGKYYETGKSPLPCTALSSSCFVDTYWDLYPCSIWDEKVGNLRENGFDLQALWDSHRRKSLRKDVIDENCNHCWTPCEAYPTILGNLAKAALSAAR